MLEYKELVEISGGANIVSGTLLSAISKLINSMLDAGRSLGSAVRRMKSGSMCPA